MVRKIYLRMVIDSKWQIFTDDGFALTDARYFRDERAALEWARAWISSWEDVEIDVDENGGANE